MNHPFVDGNKRTGHAATETFLVLNGMEIDASVDEQERVVLAIASGVLEREAFVEWLEQLQLLANTALEQRIEPFRIVSVVFVVAQLCP